MLKLKLPYSGHLMQRADSLEKTLILGKIEGIKENGMTEDEMVGWHHRLNGHEFEQTPRNSEGQGSLACCSPWGCKESDTTEWLKNKMRISCVYNYLLHHSLHGNQKWSFSKQLSWGAVGRCQQWVYTQKILGTCSLKVCHLEDCWEIRASDSVQTVWDQNKIWLQW